MIPYPSIPRSPLLRFSFQKPFWWLFCLVVAFFALGGSLQAAPTEVTVRVISKGAKFIGTSMGGVLVTLRDADTGELLARGTTRGSTGDTERIMRQAHTRGDVLSSDDAAQFTATLELEEPRWIEVAAFGPLGQRQSANRVSLTQWVVPGKHLSEGDALLLEMPGFVVDALAPAAHTRLQGLPQEVRLSANVTMMCGCPITPGGLWNADVFEVTAILKLDGKTIGTLPLDYAGEASHFQATWKIEEPGVYEAVIYAYDPNNGNTGLDRVPFMVNE